MPSIGTTPVAELMVTNIVSVKAADKMEEVAKVFIKNDINAAPVLNAQEQCVGIITSHDVVEYESSRSIVLKELCSGKYAMQIFDAEEKFRTAGMRFDEAGFHMTTSLHTATPDDPLSRVAKQMCRQHVHHVIVLDEDERPIGLLSSLDLVGFVVNEPVSRSASSSVSK